MTAVHTFDGGMTRPRWLILGSLALNLFLLGIIASMLLRPYLFANPGPADRSDAARIERLAASLAAPDADKLRAQFTARRADVDAARETIRRAQDSIRGTLRAQPFNADAMRAAMAQSRAARQSFDQVLQALILDAATEMSPTGRSKLADWPPGPRS